VRKNATLPFPTSARSRSGAPFMAWRPADPASMRQPPSPYDKTLSLAALGWLSELALEVAPLALASRFPRIVNRLARFWDSPQMIEAYFEDLLIDRRGNRQGFPPRILNELLVLAKYHRARCGNASPKKADALSSAARYQN
jgi:hypothetical protein